MVHLLLLKLSPVVSPVVADKLQLTFQSLPPINNGDNPLAAVTLRQRPAQHTGGAGQCASHRRLPLKRHQERSTAALLLQPMGACSSRLTPV